MSADAAGAMPTTPEGSTAVAVVAAAAAAAAATDVRWLIDNAEAYDALLDACRSARASIWMTQLAFDADCVAWRGDDSAAEDAGAVPIVDVLLRAAARAVDVRILLNASRLLDTATALRAHVAAAGASAAHLRIRGIDRFPQLLHAKIVVIDGATAFLVGSPFANGYWDDSQHLPEDGRRPPRELGGRPLHDLSLQLGGRAADALADVFAELWNGADDIAGDDDAPMAEVSRDDDADAPGPRIVRSAPRPRRASHPAERTEILPALLEGIRGARRLIYVEHQYLSSIAVIDALSDALARRRALELIVVLNQNPDVTAYRGWQNRRLASSGLFGHPRVGLFGLWTTAPQASGDRAVVNQVFVHSKVVAVDDRWAMVGSANLDGVSLQTYGDDFSSALGQRVFRGVRNFDVAAIVADPARVLELRTALWREHLDRPDLDADTEPVHGWLAEWRRCAAEHARWLSTASGEDAPRRLILPYSRSSTPVRQLRDAGVTFAKDGPVVAFNPSWLEVHLSPNWVRNMFA